MVNKNSRIILLSLASIILLSLIVRILYAKTVTIPSVYPDSVGYFRRAQGLFDGPALGTWVQYARTPVFPFLLGIPFVLKGQLHNDLRNGMVPTAVSEFLYIQHVIGIGCAILFFYILRKLQFSTMLSFFLAAVFGTNLLLIPWEWTVLTESWGVAWVVVFLFYFVSYYQQQTYRRAIVLALCLVVGILLRPIFLPFGVLLPLVMLIFQQPLRKKIMTIGIFGVIAGIIAIYILLNGVLHQAYIFQLVSSINLLGRILNDNIPLGNMANSDIGMHIQTYRVSGNVLNPFSFMASEFPDWETDPRFATGLQSFVTGVLFTSPIGLLQSIMKSLPEAFGTVSTAIFLSSSRTNAAITLLSLLQKGNLFLFCMSVIFTPFCLFHLFIKKRDNRRRVLIVMGITVMVVTVPTLLYSYEDYARLMTPYIPIYLVLFGYVLEEVVAIVSRRYRKL